MKTKITKHLRYWCFTLILLMSLMVQGRENYENEISVANIDVAITTSNEDLSVKSTNDHICDLSANSSSDIVAHNGDDKDNSSKITGAKITICHRPPGNPDNVQTIEISVSAWPAHEAHGDSMGACSNDENDDDSDEEVDGGCYAESVIAFEQGPKIGSGSIAVDRSNPNVALGEPDRSNAAGGFVSLGDGGGITLQFAGAVYDLTGDDIMVYETSYSGDVCGKSDDETAEIYLSQDGSTWVSYGEICRDAAIDINGLGLDYVTQIKIVSTATTPDGYDVDGVEAINGCQDVPQDSDECYGSYVVVDSYLPGMDSEGNPLSNPARMDASKALGAPQVDDTNNFVSLGYGGQITIGFDGVVLNQDGDDFVVVETSFGGTNFSSYPESADVYVSQNGVDFYLVGSAKTNESASFDISNAPLAIDFITQVRLIDTTPTGSVSDDGYDLDGIISLTGCTVPEDPNFDVCYATEILEYVEGTKKNGGVIASIRTATPENVLGEPEGTDAYVFTTLGYGGSITLAFEGSVLNGEGDDLLFVETSFNQPMGCDAYPEFADVYVSFDNFTYHFAGTVCKANNTIDFSDAGDFEYINFVKIVNNNELSTTEDGYDLDGVVAISTCTAYDPDTDLSTKAQEMVSSEITMFPVPATNKLTVKLTRTLVANSVSYEIVSILGQTYNRGTFEVKSGQTEISEDISRLADGSYFFVLNVDGTTTTKQFVKTSR